MAQRKLGTYILCWSPFAILIPAILFSMIHPSPPTFASSITQTLNVRALATNSTTQSIPNTTGTLLTFDTNTYDTSGIHSTTINTSRFTVPAGQAGTWLGFCQVTFAANVDTVNDRALSMTVNGMATNSQVSSSGSAIFQKSMSITMPLPLNVGDYMECVAFQASGGALLVEPSTTFGAILRLN
jgi:hypothetical protein